MLDDSRSLSRIDRPQRKLETRTELPITDEDFKAAQAGDQEAYGRIVAILQDKLRWHIMSKVRDEEVAKDIIQDTFIASQSRIGSSTSIQGMIAYFYAAANNRLRNHWRDDSRHAALRRKNFGPDAEFYTDKIHANTGASPEVLAEKREELKNVLELAKKILNPQQFAIIELAAQGFEMKEIAEQLNLNIGTVLSGLFRARTKLRAAVAEQ